MILAKIRHPEFWQMFTNLWFWCGIGGWIVASFVKIVLACRKTHRFDLLYLVRTGGMPSSHSAAVAALTFGIGYTEGFDRPLTVLALSLAIITMLDAASVRRAAGEHAKALNKIVRGKPFKETLGHTWPEVFWGMVTGIVWATLLCHFWR